ncbi:hypothetical protein [Halostella salina]|uniref:hypothetical protein n=1 Tax=Halostella salina TaxID=1547897 RepID=UPI000EF76F88|nr:hypothetical protein [Halostella salina]
MVDIDRITPDRIAPGAVGATGLSIIVYTLYRRQVLIERARCDGCAPNHPLFTITPLLVGTVLLLISLYLYKR